MKFLAVIAALLAMLFSGVSSAQPYVWGGLGIAKADLRTIPNVSGTDHPVIELGAGYRFNRYFGIEGGYFNLPLYQKQTGTLTTSWSASGYSVAVVGALPLSEIWSLIGQAGILRTESEFMVTVPGTIITENKTKLGSLPMIAAGIQYQFDPLFGIRAIYRHIQSKDSAELDSVDLFSLGIMLSF